MGSFSFSLRIMIEFVPGKYSQIGWEKLADRVSFRNLMQSWAWGEAKRVADGWRVERGIFRNGDVPAGMAQAMIRPLPGVGSLLDGGLCWVNRGPLPFADAGTGGGQALFDQLLEALRRHYGEERHFYLRVAPPSLGDPSGPPAMPRGYRPAGPHGWASAVLSLEPGVEALRAGLRANWRNKLNKAERSGIEIERMDDAPSLLDFAEEYRGFLADRGFSTTVTPDLLAALFEAASRMGAASCYRARLDGAMLGSIAAVRYGDTIEYLAATTSEAARAIPVGQALVWRAIADACAAGLRAFDVSGMDPETTPKGIYEFKSGLNAQPYRLPPEIEAIGGGLRAAMVRWRVGRARQAA